MMAAEKPDEKMILSLSASSADPFDATIRLLVDAQRYGFCIHRLEIKEPAEGVSALRLDMKVPVDCNITNIRDRFSRHDAVRQVDVRAQ